MSRRLGAKGYRGRSRAVFLPPRLKGSRVCLRGRTAGALRRKTMIIITVALVAVALLIGMATGSMLATRHVGLLLKRIADRHALFLMQTVGDDRAEAAALEAAERERWRVNPIGEAF